MDQHENRSKNNINKTNEIFKFQELIVLLPILCVSLLRGIASNADRTRLFGHIKTGELGNTFAYYEIILILAPLPGIILITFISEIKGRKIVFILLFALCLLSGIFSYIPYQQPWATMENFVVAVLRGGVSPITTIAICEYCGPKHRFAYLVTNEMLIKVGAQVTSILYSAAVISKESSYLSVYEIIIALVCLGSVYWWPESPYWLAGQGRYQDSRAALLRLRREGSEARGELHALETSRRRSTPKLFWLALFIAFLIVTVARSTYSGQNFLYTLNDKVYDSVPQISNLSYSIIFTCASLIVSLIIVIFSYKVKRKVIYLSTAIISFALLYVVSIWTHKVAGHVNNPVGFYITLFTCNILLDCCPFNISLALLNECIPQKYNTLISCLSYVYFTVSIYFFSYLPLNYHGSFPAYGFMLLFATLALVAVFILYWLLPETRGKNLKEVEKLYISRLYGKNPEQDQIVLEDLPK